MKLPLVLRQESKEEFEDLLLRTSRKCPPPMSRGGAIHQLGSAQAAGDHLLLEHQNLIRGNPAIDQGMSYRQTARPTPENEEPDSLHAVFPSSRSPSLESHLSGGREELDFCPEVQAAGRNEYRRAWAWQHRSRLERGCRRPTAGISAPHLSSRSPSVLAAP